VSGLPDQLPENDVLRKQHAPLSDFVAHAIRTPLQFAPGPFMAYLGCEGSSIPKSHPRRCCL
jgi:hypothetical protein